jgi:hypothetical protein
MRATPSASVAYQSALGKGKNIALFDLNAAHPINGTLFKTEAVEYKFEQANNTYYIPKYHPDWARKSGIDPESEIPHFMSIFHDFRSASKAASQEEAGESQGDNPK